MDIYSLLDYVNTGKENGDVIKYNDKEYKIIKMLGNGYALGVEHGHDICVSNVVYIHLKKFKE